jgi:hypothetical protein
LKAPLKREKASHSASAALTRRLAEIRAGRITFIFILGGEAIWRVIFI